MTEEPGEPNPQPLAPNGTPATSSRARQLAVVALALAVLGGGAAYLLTRPDNAEPPPDPDRTPAQASERGFCGQYAQLVNVHDGTSVLDWAAAMAKVGTPKDLSGKARAGFVVVLKRAERVPEGATADDLARRDANLGDTQARNVKAFTDYAASTCARQLESALSGPGSTELVP